MSDESENEQAFDVAPTGDGASSETGVTLPVQAQRSEIELTAEKFNTFGNQPAAKLSFSAHAGPLPSPSTLRAYGEINPSYPDIIVGWTTEEQRARHRQLEHEQRMDVRDHDLRAKDQSDERRETKRAQILVFVILLCCVVLSAFAYSRDDLGFATLFFAPVVAQVIRLIWPPKKAGEDS